MNEVKSEASIRLSKMEDYMRVCNKDIEELKKELKELNLLIQQIVGREQLPGREELHDLKFL